MGKSGLILEGGAIRGIFTAGVLDFLMEKDYYFPYVAGVSAGSGNAVSYVARQKGRMKNCMIITEKENQYISLKNVIRKRSLFDMDLLYDRFPNEIFPFDYDTYFHSDIHCELVVTNCLTGKAEYLSEKADRERLMAICRASSSIPVGSPMVTVDGVPYLDGGLADSIPILHALETGHKKNVLVLTRNYGYRKRKNAAKAHLYHAFYKDYPELLHTICNRTKEYNRTMMLVEKWENEGRIFVIRPETPEISRTEQDAEVLEAFYRHGYGQMKKQFEKMKEFLESE